MSTACSAAISVVAEATAEDRLTVLAERLDTLQKRGLGCARATLKVQMKIGDTLVEAKDLLPHGRFGLWLDENFKGSQSTAGRYIKAAKNRDRLPAFLENVSDESPASIEDVSLDRFLTYLRTKDSDCDQQGNEDAKPSSSGSELNPDSPNGKADNKSHVLDQPNQNLPSTNSGNRQLRDPIEYLLLTSGYDSQRAPVELEALVNRFFGPDFIKLEPHGALQNADEELHRSWSGPVFFFPPLTGIKVWVSKLTNSYKNRDVEEAIALVPNRSDDNDWMPLFDDCPVCHVRKQMAFVDGFTGEEMPAPFANILCYLGDNVARFASHFDSFGPVYFPASLLVELRQK